MSSAKNSIQQEINKIKAQISQNEALLDATKEPELKQMIVEDNETLNKKVEELITSIKALETDYSEEATETSSGILINPDTAILEVRAGTGGQEAGLFASDLFHMYSRFCDSTNLKFEPIFLSSNELGGIKTASAKIKGKGVYALLKHESGIHRVQRVPTTESSGRIHTSAASVAVLPELKKTRIEIKPEDLKWDFFRSGGKGGQNVNKVSTAVRLTHIPTDTIVECQEERTQGKNREKALKIMESRLFVMMQEQKVGQLTELRTTQVGSGDRSEKIRTYNFPQDRITDHRISKTWHNLPSVMNGDIEQMLSEVSQNFVKKV